MISSFFSTNDKQKIMGNDTVMALHSCILLHNIGKHFNAFISDELRLNPKTIKSA